MTHKTTTYNNSGNINLPSFKEGMGKVLLFLIMLMMGAGSAWAQVCNVVL